jgi:hypothetical protein
MAPSRRSNRAPKPKKHYELTPYLSRRPREASLTPNSIIYLEFPPFEPLVITEYPTSIHIPEGTRDPMTIFNLFFTPAILRLFIE